MKMWTVPEGCPGFVMKGSKCKPTLTTKEHTFTERVMCMVRQHNCDNEAWREDMLAKGFSADILSKILSNVQYRYITFELDGYLLMVNERDIKLDC